MPPRNTPHHNDANTLQDYPQTPVAPTPQTASFAFLSCPAACKENFPQHSKTGVCSMTTTMVPACSARPRDATPPAVSHQRLTDGTRLSMGGNAMMRRAVAGHVFPKILSAGSHPHADEPAIHLGQWASAARLNVYQCHITQS